MSDPRSTYCEHCGNSPTCSGACMPAAAPPPAPVPATPSISRQMESAIADLAGAIDRHHVCKRRIEAASREETAALNKVNEAQKRIDALVAEMVRQSPPGSDWRCRPLGKS